jgi:hypothetical protein
VNASLPVGATCSFSPAQGAVQSQCGDLHADHCDGMRAAMNSSNRPFNPLMPGGMLLGGISAPLVFRRRRTLARRL